jgi:ligand-binding sensor domain-containing protein
VKRLAPIFLVCAYFFSADSGARAQEVVETLGANAEVHDVLAFGDRTLLATSGGLLVVREGVVTQRINVAEGLPGARLRSLSLVGDEVFVGGVDGLAILFLQDDELQVRRTLPIRRVQRVIRWNGALWIAGFAGLSRLTDADAEPEPVPLGTSGARRRLTDLLVTRDGHELWVASAGAGVIRLDAQGHVLGRLTQRQGLRHNHVWDLETRGDEVLIGTLDGVSVARDGAVVRRHALTRASARLPVRDVRQLVVFESKVHAVTFGGGVRSLEGQSSDSERRAYAAALTSEGLVVAHSTGASVVGGAELVGGGLPSADVTALARAFGRIWIGTFDQGLATMRTRSADGTRVISRVSQASARYAVDGRINDLAVTGRGSTQRLWIATDRGLFWHDGRRYVPVEASSGPGRTHVTSLHVDAEGELWVTSSRVLSRWNPGQDTWQHWDSDAGFPVAQLHAVTTRQTDGGQEVWVGSLHGLYRFDPVAGHAEAHTVATGDLPVDWVTALATLSGQLVVGTYHGGLAWQGSDEFHIEAEAQGLPAGWVNPHAMKSISGALYVGTLDRGLLIGRRGHWTHLQVAEGLPSNDVTDVLSDGDHVWVATRAGIVRLRR